MLGTVVIIRKDEELLENSWRAFWIAHDLVVIEILLGVCWKSARSLVGVSWESNRSQLGVEPVVSWESARSQPVVSLESAGFSSGH